MRARSLGRVLAKTPCLARARMPTNTIAMIRKVPPLDDYVVETLMPDLIAHDHMPSAFLVYVKLWHACGGPGRRAVEISLSTLSVETGFLELLGGGGAGLPAPGAGLGA